MNVKAIADATTSATWEGLKNKLARNDTNTVISKFHLINREWSRKVIFKLTNPPMEG